MNLPTSADLRGLSTHLRLNRVRDTLLAERPDLAGEVSTERASTLTIELPAHGDGSHRRVTLTVRPGMPGHCLVIGPGRTGLMQSVWPLDAGEEQLAGAVLAMYAACLNGTRVASPWRWGQAEESTITELADRMEETGMEVEAVVSDNRMALDPERRSGVRTVPATLGDALRVRTRIGKATLARRPTIGWVLDLEDDDGLRRLDLAAAANADTSPLPGLATEDTSLLLAAVRRLLTAPEPRPEHPSRFHPGADPDQQTHEAAARWLSSVGFRGIVFEPSGATPIAGPIHVVVARRRAGVTAVKVAYADAVLAGKPLVLFAGDGFTRDARAFADQAGVVLFAAWDRGAHMRPESDLAAEYVRATL